MYVNAIGLGCMGLSHASGTPMCKDEAIKDFRNEIVLCTKFGVTHKGDHLELDSSPQKIRESLEGSLKRLQTDYIDIYYQHRIDPLVEPEVVASVMKELI